MPLEKQPSKPYFVHLQHVSWEAEPRSSPQCFIQREDRETAALSDIALALSGKSEINLRKNRTNITFPKLFFGEILGENVNEYNAVKRE
jgi:hypothetical protein